MSRIISLQITQNTIYQIKTSYLSCFLKISFKAKED